jgi:hypothetical protein
MKNSRFATAVVVQLMACVLAVPAIAQQQHPNTASGFKADATYDLLGLDNVNVFNGNLIVRLPLGLRYPNGGGSSFGLTLSYNSRAWAFEQRKSQERVDVTDLIQSLLSDGDGFVILPDVWPTYWKPYMLAYPDRRNNAGIGWSVSLGQLFAVNDTNLANQEGFTKSVGTTLPNPAPSDCVRSAQDCHPMMYISPDGAEHVIHPDVSGVYYTHDTTYIRIKRYAANANEVYPSAVVDFGDGGHQTFEQFTDAHGNTHFRVRKIRDAFGNLVTINYDDPHRWKITDAFQRVYTVIFVDGDKDASGKFLQPNFPLLVSEIDVPKFGTTTVTSQYKFSYELRTVGRDLTGASAPGEENDTVPLLKSLSMPEGQTYDFEYNGEAELAKMTLPTGGHLEWAYGVYALPTESCDHQWESLSIGVVERKVFDNVHPPMTSRYQPKIERLLAGGLALNAFKCACDSRLNDISGNYVHFLSIQHAPLPLATVTTTAPSGEKTVHYFSVWPVDNGYCTPPPELTADFGLPYTRRFKDASGQYFLSEETFDTAGRRIRVKYVTYDDDEHMAWIGGMSDHEESNRRLKSAKVLDLDPASSGAQTTVPPAGSITAETTTGYSDWDGAGHYRTATTTSWAGTSRTTTTNYQPNTTTWLLNLFDSVTSSQTSTESVLSSVKEVVKFDPNTGFLLGRRRLLNPPAIGAHDVLALYTPDSAGNAIREEWYGGDTTSLATADPFTPGAAATYRTDYTYDHGVAATSMAVNPPATNFLLLSKAAIDPATSLVKSASDPAGCSPAANINAGCQWTVTYTYDGLGRITEQIPVHAARTRYGYINATSTTPAQVNVDRRNTFTILERTQYIYDALGRLAKEIIPTAAPGGTATRTTTYDEYGRKSSVSEWQGPGETLHLTTFSNFDPFGRAQTVTGPDASTITFSFTGDRTTRRTVTPSIGTSYTTTEERDSFGQLTRVTEPSGIGNTQLCTSYAYDVAGHLSIIKPMDANCAMAEGSSTNQRRSFSYDGRGFLASEHVPEKGTTNAGGDVTYAYDAKGHAAKVIDVGREVDNTYDAAERLKTVGTPTQALKEFYYDSVPGDSSYPPLPGRLYETVRHNYTSTGDQPVKQFFKYENLDGDLSHKITDVGGGKTFAQSISVNILGDPIQLNYPTCSACGAGAGLARQINRAFTNSVLTDVDGFTARPFEYASNGMLTKVTHANGVVDAYTPDPSGIARPSAISFAGTNVCSAPSNLNMVPEAFAIATGSPARLHVTGGGTLPITYTWHQQNAGSSTDLIAGIGPDLTTGPLSVSAIFWVVATNSCSPAGTQSGTLIITVSDSTQSCTAAPVLTWQPASQSAISGSSVTMNVGTAGAGCRFQWYKGNSGDVSLPLGTTQTISVTPAATSNYWVRVTNNCGSTDSTAATITISGSSCSLPPPSMTASQTTIAIGRSTTISTPAIGGATYRWEKYLGFSSWGTLPDTTPSITVSPTTNTSYRVIVTAPCGAGSTSATAVAMEIVVHPPAAYDFDGDGIPDVVWHDQPASRLWVTSGADVVNNRPWTTLVEYSIQSIPDWRINGVGDLDADYFPDLVWHENGFSDNIAWRWNGTQFLSSQWFNISINDSTINDPEWLLQGAGAYRYGTGPITDLVFRSYRTGVIRVVPIDHFSGLTPITLPGDPDLSWKIVAVGNIDNDGATDLVWRQYGTGRIRIWFMGHVGEFGTDSNGVRRTADLGTDDEAWRIVEVADFNGDGFGDILWHNPTSGAMRIWQTSSVNWASPARIGLAGTMTGTARVAGGGDYNACTAPVVTIANSGGTTFCAPSSVTLTAQGGTRWVWSNGSTAQAITVTQSGSYTVTGFTPEGCSATSTAVNVTVNPQPAASITANGPLDITLGQERVLTASSGSTWSWSTGETTQSIAVSATGNYSVRITNANGCFADAPAMHVTVHPPAPTNVVASVTTINNALAVNVTYTPVAGATYSYIVQRSAGLVPGTLLWQNFVTVANPDPSVVPGTTYYYRVIANDGAQSSSTGNTDVVTVMRFTDDPVAIPGTLIKAVHITELRTAVNAVRASAGLPAYTTWAIGSGALPTQKSSSRDITELRNALNEALDRLVVLDWGLGRPLYDDPLLAPAFPVRRTHIQQLRDRVK